jgi:hypothetical protein
MVDRVELLRPAVKSITQDISLIKHFRAHLESLSDPMLLDLLSLASLKLLTNAEARTSLKLSRTQTWAVLSRLAKVGMLERTDGGYKATPYAEHLLAALSVTFQSVLAGKSPRVHNPTWRDVLRIAYDGAELSYARGKITESEYSRQVRLLGEVEGELNGLR